MAQHPLQTDAGIDSPTLWSAGAGLLSLALMDARNHTLSLLQAFEQAEESGAWHGRPGPGQEQPLWWAGHAAWFAERWIGRNTCRNQGVDCPPEPLRLASVDPGADRWWDPALSLAAERATQRLPEPAAVRAWMLDTLESTLELLDRADDSAAALYFFRQALFHEDLVGERLVQLAQAQGVPLGLAALEAWVPRPAVGLPGTRWSLHHRAAGWVPEGHQGRLEVYLPEFEIDAQPVTWAQYVEFVDDGGYERPELWLPEGWQWLQAQGQRSAPRFVEQMGVARAGGSGAVLQMHFGRRTRCAAQQPVCHVSWWEAEAWCRWAGRRLPDEAEWDLAAHQAGRRGFRWGGVNEWTATRLQPWPGAQPGPWRDQAWPLMGQARVLRGYSQATRARQRDAGRRSFALPGEDADFTGFRSCAV